MTALLPRFASPEVRGATFPILPDGMERDGFIRLFQSVAKPMFGLTDAEVISFTMMAQDPRPQCVEAG